MTKRWGWWLALWLVACNAAPTDPSLRSTPLNHTPEIVGLTLKPSSGVAPLPVTLAWVVADADTQPLSCKIDFDGDGTYDLNLPVCTNSARAYTYAQPGTYTLKFHLEDGNGGITEEAREVSVKPNSNPVIQTFSASAVSGQVAFPVTFRWNVEDPEADPLTCKLDVDGSGTFKFTLPNCDSSSVANFTYTAPSSYTPKLRVEDNRGGMTEQTLESPVIAQPDQYDITLRINGFMSDPVRVAFENARAFWSSVIVKGLTYEPNFSVPANSCLGQFPAFSGSVDDVLIDVQVIPLDGIGGVQGQAGTCWTHSDSYLTLYGVMQFDQEDLEAIGSQGLLNRLILHEMGHVLGFGTLWDFKRSLISGGGVGGTCGGTPVFVGANAVREWQKLGGKGNVPLENTGGQGTCNSHWQESTFGNELMTGYLNPGSNPLSRVTIASLEDLGYTVNYEAAEDYTLPTTVAGQSVGIPLRIKEIKPLGVWRP